MILLKIKKFILGYVLVNIKAFKLEQVLNRITSENVFVWDVKKVSDNEYTFKILYSEYEQIASKASNMGAHIRIIKKIGLSNLIDKIKRRKYFVLTFLILISIFIYMSSFVWSVSIYGNRILSDEYVKKLVYQSGIKELMKKKEVDLKSFENKLLSSEDKIGYIQISYKGSSVKIQIFEKEAPITLYNKNVAVDLVANESGNISEITAYTGTAKVKNNQKVKSGQVLISGTIKFEEKGKEKKGYVHALGKALIRKTELSEPILVDMYKPKANASYISKKDIYLFNKVFSIKNKTPDENDVIVYKKSQNLTIFKYFKLPILYDETRFYNKEDCIQLSNDVIYKNVNEKLEKKLGDRAYIRNVEYLPTTAAYNRLSIRANVTYDKSIGVEKKIKVKK